MMFYDWKCFNMTFNEFISSLNEGDKKNYDDYSKIRGKQQYRIIFETLYRINQNVTYSDVNAFIIYDKAIKDILFKYLGTLEELIRNDIMVRYDFAPEVELKGDEYHYFSQLPKCIRKENLSDEITIFYKKFSLNFGDLISFLEEYEPDKYDIDKLKKIKDLRNSVMHHAPLLFNYNFDFTSSKVIECISLLRNMLPVNYQKGIIENLDKPTKKTKENLSPNYHHLLLSF